MTAADFLTPEIKSYVNSYLMARAYAETMRAAVDKIALEILTECPIYTDRDERRGVIREPEKILRSKDLYLCSDDALCKDFYAEANKRERAAGLKKADMPDDHCPALVAEHLQMQVEHLLIDASGRHCGVSAESLYSGPHALENGRKWIDLVVGLVVNSPDFKGSNLKAA